MERKKLMTIVENLDDLIDAAYESGDVAEEDYEAALAHIAAPEKLIKAFDQLCFALTLKAVGRDKMAQEAATKAQDTVDQIRKTLK